MIPGPDSRPPDKWTGLHPVLVRRLRLVHAAMAALEFPMLLTDGVRSEAEQRALYAIGRTKPGRIVTNADGVQVRSNHQARGDGFGYAADCCFLVNGRPDWSGHLPWETYGACARAVGLRWGIRVGSWIDRPHVELPDVR